MNDAEHEVDRVDLQILKALQLNARLSSAELAERVDLTTSPCWRRVKRLEQEGIICGYHADVDMKKLGFHVTAYVYVSLDKKDEKHVKAFEDAVITSPQIIACSCISGRYDHQLTVVARTLDEFGEFARHQIGALPNVKEVYSAFVLKEVKSRKQALVDLT
ncbi:Lrp/AsnC family transcriptional regulator [Paraburkholderia unamae]|uniref:AsnC family transcriptional regulator n=1 Tax=Paraburkholderia unamae TaxID=219649 RepID=A0ABX5KHT8_9BURK|nr:Lrp/AsnC family transcriptional regulator [Paraburkholderia unamae]PVX80009.1 AsnC family transcriptional regulator [Paraburkholderia unamae]RAR52268.1 AsnC family transcriptional regulator [Paraburkholderia unamae]CAG9268631.1 AsnC family transcriptional regulator [Paraburkholderia unamae]